MINNNIIIDVAVLCQEYTHIDSKCENHTINLDDINISECMFKQIFFPYGENFGIDKQFACSDAILPYISFSPIYRTVNKHKFYLLEQIFKNLEEDLNISRNCFTVESRVELTNEISSINSLCDINCCSVLASLTWSNIIDILKNYRLINDTCCDEKVVNKGFPICSISVVFKTPTPEVNNTIIRFNYKIINL